MTLISWRILVKYVYPLQTARERPRSSVVNCNCLGELPKCLLITAITLSDTLCLVTDPRRWVRESEILRPSKTVYSFTTRAAAEKAIPATTWGCCFSGAKMYKYHYQKNAHARAMTEHFSFFHTALP